jgi:hypothetical protein
MTGCDIEGDREPPFGAASAGFMVVGSGAQNRDLRGGPGPRRWSCVSALAVVLDGLWSRGE